MKHAIVFAHPKKESFNAVIASTYAKTVVERGHVCQLRDLYEMDFDPCLASTEIPGPHGFSPREDVIAERSRL